MFAFGFLHLGVSFLVCATVGTHSRRIKELGSFYSAEDLVLVGDDDPSHRAHKEIWVWPKLVIEIREHCLSAKA
jgi:hypothetical protein